ncbi:MAG: anti-sigma factor family protein [Acidimicrobiales bacterium]
MTNWPPAGGGADTFHLDEVLSSYLDGELDDATYQQAYQHLASCHECQAQLEELSHVRTALRNAPPIEPPFGFIERVVRQRRRRPVTPVLASVVGIAAVWLLVLGLVAGGGALRIEPPVGDIATAQAGLVPGDADQVRTFRADDIQFERTDRGDIPGEFRAPEDLGGAEYDAGFEAVNRDGWLAVYEADDEAVVVYQQAGEYEPGSLPGGGEEFEIDGDPAWRAAVEGRNTVVVQRGEMTYTIVGALDVEDLVEIAEELPERQEVDDPSFGDRLRGAAEQLLEGFSLGL